MEKEQELMLSPCPEKFYIALRVSSRHILMVLSTEQPQRRSPSGLNATVETDLLKPLKDIASFPSSLSHTLIRQSPPPVAIYVPV